MGAINQKIKELRQHRGLTLQQLADLTRLTRSYLSKIERQRQPPPVSTLQTIGAALGADMDDLLGATAAEHTFENLDLLHDSKPGGARAGNSRAFSYRPLVNRFRNKFMMPFLMRVTTGTTDYFEHDSEEFVYVVQGKLEFLYQGNTHRLDSGDSLYFDSRAKHAFRNRGKQDVVLVTVNFNYKRF